MPDQPDKDTLKKIVGWSVAYYQNPKLGNRQRIPTEQEVYKQFGIEVPHEVLESHVKDTLGIKELESHEMHQDDSRYAQEPSANQKTQNGRRPGPYSSVGKSYSPTQFLQAKQQATLAKDLEPAIQELLKDLDVKGLTPDQIKQITSEASMEAARQTTMEAYKIQDVGEIPARIADNLTQTLIVHPEIADKLKLDELKIFEKAAKATSAAAEKNKDSLEKLAAITEINRLVGLSDASEPTISIISQSTEDIAAQNTPLSTPTEKNTLEAGFSKRYLDAYKKTLTNDLKAVPNKLPSLEQLQQIKEKAHTQALKQATEGFYKTENGQQIGQKFNTKHVAGTIANELNLASSTDSKIPATLKIPLLGTLSFSNQKEMHAASLAVLAHDQPQLDKAIKEQAAIIERFKKKKSLSHQELKEYQFSKKLYARYMSAKAFAAKQPGKQAAYMKLLSKPFGNRGELVSQSAWQQERFMKTFLPRSMWNNPRLVAALSFSRMGYSFPRQSIPSMLPQNISWFSSSYTTVGRSPTVWQPSSSPGMVFPQRPTSSFMNLTGQVSQSAGTMGSAGRAGTNIAGSAAKAGGAISSIGGTAKSLSGIAKLAGAAKMLTPTGLAATIAQSKIARKIIAGAVAIGGYLLLMLGAKILGAIAGLAFGAVTGLPLLAIPGVGPFLYGGWVAYWTAHGFLDPFGTFSTIVKALSLPGKALSFIKSGFGIPSATSSILGGIGSIFGSAGSFITGAGQSILGGITSIGGNLLGGISGGLNLLVGGGLGTSLSAATILLPVGGAIGTVGITGLLVGTVTATAFSTIATDQGQITPGTNQYFVLTKTANPTSISNSSLPTTVNYTITLEAKTNIQNIAIKDELKVQPAAPNPQDLSSRCNPQPPSGLSAGQKYTCSFSANAENSFHDSVMINTVTATATPQGGSSVTSTFTVNTNIGSPAANCPHGWSAIGRITQGPEGADSHADNVYGGYEAIDIGQGAIGGMGKPVYATVDGTVEVVWKVTDTDHRIRVKPTNCSGLSSVNYWHLSETSITAGQSVKFGQEIGKTGSAGSGPHTHYQFNETGQRNFKMEAPNIPQSPKSRTCDSEEECGVTITSAP
ncbi:MAG TPA: M23 family metallopeptidase [Candidatus Saccharimonadales bacterium]|nr:M23 family metallopeptidase [Candidatus Saccharimonadales bacterium]